MTNPVKSDDSDEKWEGYPGHTKAKHDLLGYYLDIWFRKLGSSQRKLRVFDCFAGRGEYYAEDEDESLEINHINTDAEYPGSPQLILDRAVARSGNFTELECVFIDKEARQVELLQDNLPDRGQLPNNIDYRVVQGKFQEETPKLVRETGGWSDPCFFFLDPFGYSPLDYDVVTKLSGHKRFEIFVNLMASDVHRFLDTEKHHDAIRNLFGTDDWHEELEQHQPEHWNDKEVSYYCERLEENGPEYTRAYLVTEEDSRRMKYYLVFGTNSSHGVEKMHASMKNCGHGEFAYAPKRPGLHENQQGLSLFTEDQRINQLKNELLNNFEGESLTFDKLVREFVTKLEYHESQRKDIRQATKDLESEGEVSVSRQTSKTEHGLGGKDILEFP